MAVTTLKIEEKHLRSIDELTSESPLAQQPPGTNHGGIRLRPHQRAALYRMKQLEKKQIDICPNGYLERLRNGTASEQDSLTAQELKLSTSFGLLSDPVGAGKSYVILALVVGEKPSDQDRQVLSACNNKVIMERKMPPNTSIKTNLIIIPSSLIRQWQNYMDNFLPTSLKRIVLSNKRQMDHLFENGIQHYDVIVMSLTFYKTHFMLNTIGTEMENLSFRRIICDEVDTLDISRLFKADFYWYISASVNNLFTPRGDYRRNIEGFSYKRGPIFNDLLQISNINVFATAPFIVRNSARFITESYQLPEPIVRTIMCREPASINILSGVVDRHVLNCLNANDYQGAVSSFNTEQRTSEDNIVEFFIKQFRNKVNNFDRMIAVHSNPEYIYETEQQRNATLMDLERKKNNIINQINAIEQRIKQSNECAICYVALDGEQQQIQTKTIIGCCQNSFCFKCINTWLLKSVKCPLCKTTVSKNDLRIVEKNNGASTSNPEEDFTRMIHENNSKEVNIQNIIKSLGKETKILIFSAHNTSDNLVRWLHSNGIQTAEPKGNKYVVDGVISSYKEGNTRVLFLNPYCFGAGLNLENTTDIIMMHKMSVEMENQIIGRAQRYGRTTNLRVWHLRHSNEAQHTSQSLQNQRFFENMRARPIEQVRQAQEQLRQAQAEEVRARVRAEEERIQNAAREAANEAARESTNEAARESANESAAARRVDVAEISINGESDSESDSDNESDYETDNETDNEIESDDDSTITPIHVLSPVSLPSNPSASTSYISLNQNSRRDMDFIEEMRRMNLGNYASNNSSDSDF